MTILAIDIGTTGLKMGVFQSNHGDVKKIADYSEAYTLNRYQNALFGDIDAEKWINAFRNGCKVLQKEVTLVEILSLSGTTPGLTAMDKDGNALFPAILMLDQRSRKQAQFIIDTVGLEELFAHTGNMPVAGGCSLASILWIKENRPDVYRKTYKFGHSNTYFAHWLTGNYAMDPSSASLTALYNTVKNDFTWNEHIAYACGVSTGLMPDLIPASDAVGIVKPELCRDLGFRKQPHVLIGGNDAVLAAYSAGIQEPGDKNNVNGTCEINLVCLPDCVYSRHYNVRAHVIPDRWLTLHVMNAGGKAYEWFKSLFCSEMTDEEFYTQFIPSAINEWIDKESSVTYTPYLMGSRYSLAPLKAKLEGLTVGSTRAQLLAALTKGLCQYQKSHLDELSSFTHLDRTMFITGGAVNDAIIRAKKKWMWDGDYQFVQQSSMRGAALLALEFEKFMT